MNGIRAWSMAVCAAALGLSALRLIAPQRGNGKVFRLITASFFLCCLLFPLTKITRVPTVTFADTSQTISTDLQQCVTDQLSAYVQQSVYDVVQAQLTALSATAVKIEVQTECSDEGGIYMKQVVVQLDKQSGVSAETVQEVLEQQLNTTVVVKTEGDV